MDRWRQAGRASRSDDDALWERFKAAQDAFFAAKDEIAAKEDEEFRGNLAVKEELLKEAQAILPVKDLEAAKAALRTLQDKWDAAGKVPRGDVDRMEKGMRRIEQAVRDADDQRWKQSNPEVAARAQSMVDQLEASVASLKDDLAKAAGLRQREEGQGRPGQARGPGAVAGPGPRQRRRVRLHSGDLRMPRGWPTGPRGMADGDPATGSPAGPRPWRPWPWCR